MKNKFINNNLFNELLLLIKERIYLKIQLKNNLLKKTHLIKLNRKRISYIKKLIYEKNIYKIK